MAKHKKPKLAGKTHKKEASNVKTSTPTIKKERNQSWLPLLAALVITFICFYTAINNQFVNWDDDRNFYDNELVKNITSDNFWVNTKAIFTTGVIGNYNPLSIWTFAIEKLWFGLDSPLNWHLDNVLLHLICVFLVYRLVLLLGVGWRGAFLTALLFGIHPMRVESVAWVTERKDVLFGVFYLAALVQYVRFKHDQKSKRWIWIFLFFILSLFSKIQAVSLPLSMLAIDYYLDKSWTLSHFINTLKRKIPLFILSLLFGVLGVYMLSNNGSLSTTDNDVNFNFVQRMFLGAYSFIIYIVKSILPYKLSPLYPYPSSFPWYFYPSILIVPVIIYLLYRAYIKEQKAIFFGLTFFIVNIIFLLQILGAGQGFLADRFTYMAYLGIFFIIGYFFDQWVTKAIFQLGILWGTVGVSLLILGSMTFQQNKVWENSGTLWTHVLKYYTTTTLPYGNRANYYREKKMYDKALVDYQASLDLKEHQPQLYNSRARLYFEVAKGRDTLLLALNDYNKAIEYLPTDGEFRVNRGATYARLGDIQKAIVDLTEGLRLKPDHAVGYLNRSIMYHNIGKIDLALQDIESYLKYIPTNGDLWYEKGRALRSLKRPEEAISAYTEALKHPSSNPGLILYERSKTNYQLNKINEAKSDLQKAIEFKFSGVENPYKQQLGM